MSPNFTTNLPKSNGKTLILDLDETLASSLQNPQLDALQIYTDPSIYHKFHPIGQRQICYSTVVTVPSDNSVNTLRIWGVKRPGLEEFLRFVDNYFENVIVWSAGLGPYVDGICEEVFDAPGVKLPRIIWNRSNCTPGPGFYHKPLKDLLNLETIRVDLRKTLILDDRQYTFTDNPENGVLIPPFKPSGSVDELANRSDRCLYKFMDWLQRPEVMSSEDYRSLDKSNIFI